MSSTSSATDPRHPLYVSEISLSKVLFGDPKKNTRGGTFIPINYESPGKSLRVQTPSLRLPFGLTTSDQGQCSINVSFDKMDTTPEVEEFYKFIESFDKLALSTAIKNSPLWFSGRNIRSDTIEANFKHNIRPPKDEKYSPLMRFKIPISNDGHDVEVYIEQEPASIEAIQNNCHVVSIIEPRSVWFVGGNFGVSWTVRQIKITEQAPESSSKLLPNSFRVDTAPVSKGNAKSPNPPPPVNPRTKATEPTMESDSEQDEDVDLDPAPVQPQPVKKSTVVSRPPQAASKPASTLSSSSPKNRPVEPPTSSSTSKVVSKSNPAAIKSSVTSKKR